MLWSSTIGKGRRIYKRGTKEMKIKLLELAKRPLESMLAENWWIALRRPFLMTGDVNK